MRKLVLAGLAMWISGLAISAAQADTLSVYQGTCDGATSACSALNSTNTGYNSATFTTLVASGTVPSTYNYTASDNSIAGFLGAGVAGGLLYQPTYSSASAITTPGVGTQTEWVFTGTLSGPSNISITHDDGIAFFLNGSRLTDPSIANPTAASTVTFATLTGGTFALDYVSSNGLPEILKMSVSPVPLPGALPLFATGLASLGLLGWRKKRKSVSA